MKLRLLFALLIVGISMPALSQNCVRALWVKKYGNTGTEGIYYMCADSGRMTTTVTGYFDATLTLGSTTITDPTGRGYYIARFDTAGNPLMLALLGYATNANGNYITTRQIETDDAGNIYVSGDISGSVNIQGTPYTGGAQKLFIAKYDPTGAPLWVKIPPPNGGISSATGLDVDHAGNAYVTGTFDGAYILFDNDTLFNKNQSQNFYNDGFITALDPNGQVLWADRFGANGDDGGYNLALDNFGNLFLTGDLDFGTVVFSPTVGVTTTRQDWNFFVAKYTVAGVPIWVRTVEGYASSQMYSYEAICDDAGSCYVTGSCQGTYSFGNSIVITSAGSDDAWIAKFRPNGNCDWAMRGGGNNNDQGYALDYYQGKLAWCGDIFSNYPTFGNYSVPVGLTNTFTGVVDTSGTILWLRTYTASLTNTAIGSFIDASGAVYTSGRFIQTETWYPITITPSGPHDGYIVKFKPSTINTPTISAGPDHTTSCGTSVQLTGSSATPSGTTYQWQGPNGFTTTTLSPSVNPGFTAPYILTGLYQGCIKADTTLVTVAPNSVYVNAGSDVSICVGDSTHLNATGTAGATYSWLPAAGLSSATINNPWAKPTLTTDYVVCAVNGGCRAYDTVRVTVNAKPYLSLASSYSTCSGVPVTLTAGAPGYTYSWTPATGLSSTNTYSAIATPTVTQHYTVTATTPAGCSGTVTCTFTVVNNNVAPTVTIQPVNQTMCPVNSVTFTCSATGSASVNYRWEVNTGSGWTSLSSVAPYSGTSTAALVINPVASTMNGYQYRCRTYSACSPSTYSNPATLTVASSPVVSVQPPNRSICPTNNTTFTITVPGTGYTYQWQGDFGSGFVNLTNGPPYSGVTSSTLGITGATAGMNGYQYRCVVTGCSPSAATTSNPGLLSVGQPPLIQTQPVSDTNCVGGTTVFTVAQTGGTSYIWQYFNGSVWVSLTNTSPYSGAFTTTLTINPLSVTQNGMQFRCRINGGCSTITYSDTVTVTLQPAVSITGSPSNVNACPGDSVTFSSSALNAVNYQWEVNTGSGFVPLTNASPYSGVNTTVLSVSPVSAVMNGYLFRCVANGTCSSTASTTAATLSIPALLSLTTQPSGYTTCVNGSASFTVGASNALSYQWQENNGSGWTNLANGSPYSGVSTSSLNISPVGAGMSGNWYRCMMTGNCAGTMTSDSAQLNFSSGVVILSQPGSMVSCANDTVNLTFTSTGATGYQWEADFGSGYSALSNNSSYSGVTTNQLMITGTNTSMNGGAYRCVLSGCVGSDTTQSATLTVNALPNVTLNAFTTACINWPAFNLNGGSPTGGNYSGPGVSAGSFDPSVAGAGLHLIVYTYTDGNGCTDTAQQWMNVDLCLTSTVTDQQGSISLYPNPASTSAILTIDDANADACTVEIYSSEGKLITSDGYAVKGSTNIELNFNGMAKGVYFITVKTISGVRTIRMVLI